MKVSFYDVSVGSYLQALGGVASFLEKGRIHFAEQGVDPAEILTTRLHPDMRPLSFQLISVVHHSLGALRGIESGSFRPSSSESALDYTGFQALVQETKDALAQYQRHDVDAMVDQELVFQIGDRSIPFAASDFVLTFSLPNLYFHSTTAYDILRMKGVTLGKRDYLGQFRSK